MAEDDDLYGNWDESDDFLEDLSTDGVKGLSQTYEIGVTNEDSVIEIDIADGEFAKAEETGDKARDHANDYQSPCKKMKSTKIGDYFNRSNSSEPVVRENNPYRDEPGKFFAAVGGRSRIYKTGESYRSTEALLKGLQGGRPTDAVFTITEMFYGKRKKQSKSKGNFKMARCQVLVPLLSTFVENQALNPETFGDEVVYVRLRDRVEIELRQLTEKLDDPPLPKFVYVASESKTKSVGFHVSYSSLDEFQYPVLYNGKANVLDIFAGAGGMSVGFEHAGFNVSALVEKDALAAATLSMNHSKDGRVYEEDVNLFLEKARAGKPGYPKKHQIHHLHASSPCQGFSYANRTGGRYDKVNNDLSQAFPQLVEIADPITASFENVIGILDNKKHSLQYAQFLVAKLLSLRYQVRIMILDSSHYGDPQSRKRFIMLASKHGHPLPKVPEATHGEGPELTPIVSTGTALKVLERIEPEEGAGIVVVDVDGKKVTVTGHTINETEYTECKTLDEHKPAPTILTQNVFRHCRLHRNLTTREYALLHSFPLEYSFAGGPGAKRRQIGNAVPVNMATAIARSVMKCYQEDATMAPVAAVDGKPPPRASNAASEGGAAKVSRTESSNSGARRKSINPYLKS